MKNLKKTSKTLAVSTIFQSNRSPQFHFVGWIYLSLRLLRTVWFNSGQLSVLFILFGFSFPGTMEAVLHKAWGGAMRATLLPYWHH